MVTTVIIPVLGLFYRFLVNYSLGVNIFVEFTTIVSLLDYFFVFFFTVLVHKLVVFLDVNLFGILLNLVIYKLVLFSMKYVLMSIYKFII